MGKKRPAAAMTPEDGYLAPPVRMPLILRLGVWFAERKVGKRLSVARTLAWYPKAALGSGVMESLISHGSGRVTPRLLQLLRLQVSFAASCPFCIDLNAQGFSEAGISDEEIGALRGLKDFEEVPSLDEGERCALRYARALTGTPIRVDPRNLEEMLALFDEREFVVVASTIAQVNFWTRMVQGLGIPPEGFSSTCSVLHLEQYSTLRGDAEHAE